MFDAASWWLSTVVFVLAGGVKGIVGLGLPTVSMALLAQWMSPADAARLLIVPSLVTNVWQIGSWATLRSMLRRLGLLQLAVCLGTWLGVWIFGAPAGAWAEVAVGVSLILYAGWALSGARFSICPTRERWLGPLVGLTTGLMTAITGVFVVPAVPYLQSLDLPRDELVQAMGLSFTTSTIALAIGLYANASYSGAALATSMMMVAPAIAGMYGGQRIRQLLSPPVFRTCFLISLIVLGAHMIVRELLAR